MRIKEQATDRLFGIFPRTGNRAGKFIIYVVLIALISGIAMALLLTGAQIQKTGWIGHVLKPLLRENVGFIPKYIKGMTTQPERLVIDIQHKDFQHLAYNREVALEKGILMTSSDDFVPAIINYKGKTYKAKIRLKGDWTDGLLSRQWPLRVRIKGNDTLMGMKQFSLHHPRVRNYIHEWIYHQALQREGILNLRYNFVDVTINGKNLGIYALEEHFYKHLIEHQNYREGPIIKFNEDILWQDRIRAIETTGWLSWNVNAADRPRDYPDITLFQEGKTLQNPILYKQFKTASTILEQFRAGELSTSQVFDTDKLARFMALSELLGAMHSSVYWNNWRFYYNPVTSRLEPIGFDGNAGNATTQTSLSYLLKNPPFDHFFNDPVFLEKYLQALNRIAQPEYLESLLQSLEPELSEKLALLYRSHIYSFSTEQYDKNQAFIQRALHPPRVAQAYVVNQTSTNFTLEIANIQQMPIAISSLLLSNQCIAQPSSPITLSSSATQQKTLYDTYSFNKQTASTFSIEELAACKLLCHIPGLTNEYIEPIHPWLRIDPDTISNDFLRESPNWSSFEFITKSNQTLSIAEGVWNITNNLIFPANHTIACPAGTTLRLSDNVTILSYSPISFKGTKKHPITIEPLHESGQGLILLKAAATSHLEHVIFNNLAAPAQGNWELTGAVTFYESPAQFSHCTFSSNRSEDALNMIRSSFALNNCTFHDIASDAFDSDFSDGTFDNCIFSNCINDAIDISGSRVTVKNVQITRAGDKGISAGEASHLQVNSSVIDASNIGMASKDQSTLSVSESTISNCKIGLAAYQKKPEFGPALIIADQILIEHVEHPYMIEFNSELLLNQQMIEPNCQNLAESLYGTNE